MSAPLLVVLNPRRIPKCIAAIEELEIDRLWMTGYTERELIGAIPAALAGLEHDPVLFLSDDTIPTQAALDAVLELQEADPSSVATGYCNLDAGSPFVNLTRRPFTETRRSTAASYHFFTRGEAERHRSRIRSFFAGLALTCLSRELLENFPIRSAIDRPSDFDLSVRLQRYAVPIYAPPAAFVWHVKERWNLPDQAPEKQLLVGKVPQEARLDRQATDRVRPGS